MQPENDLDRLALKYRSDKFGSHFYTQHYDSCFASFREKNVHLLEIGIGGYDDPNNGGASLKMWEEYFTQGCIYGLDWHAKTGLASDRIKVFQGSQADPLAFSPIIEANPDRAFDIIVDDGSHRSEHVITTFLMMFQYVKPGGWYVIEDTQTSYWTDYSGSSTDLTSPMSTMSFFKQFIDGLNWREIHRPGYAPTSFDLSIVSMRFYHNLIFIEKGFNEEPSNFVVNNHAPRM